MTTETDRQKLETLARYVERKFKITKEKHIELNKNRLKEIPEVSYYMSDSSYRSFALGRTEITLFSTRERVEVELNKIGEFTIDNFIKSFRKYIQLPSKDDLLQRKKDELESLRLKMEAAKIEYENFKKDSKL